MVGADHGETAENGDLVITALACSLVEQSQPVHFAEGSALRAIYGRPESLEAFYCNYGVNPAYEERIFARRLRCTGRDVEGRPRAFELAGHRFFIGTLYVPQLLSSEDMPHPLITAWLAACVEAAPSSDSSAPALTRQEARR